MMLDNKNDNLTLSVYVSLCIFCTGNGAGGDDRHGEFEPSAERRDVHR